MVRERIQATYGYFAGSLVITAASAYSIARSRFIGRWMAASPLLVSGVLHSYARDHFLMQNFMIFLL